MNTPRLVVLALAAVAAGGVALLARGLMGGGTPKVAANTQPSVAMTEVLVASSNLSPGTPLGVGQVRWQKWPRPNVDGSFITHDSVPDLATAVAGTVVRAPIVTGEPLTNSKIVHSDSAGFMAANLMPGMRAVSIPISTETGAGGFILPNDRVDLLQTKQISDSPRRFRSNTLLANVRVLAVDQTYKEDANQKVVLAKTATLELTPQEAERVAGAQAQGTLTLSLRPLGESAASSQKAVASINPAQQTGSISDTSDAVAVIRYGVERSAGAGTRN